MSFLSKLFGSEPNPAQAAEEALIEAGACPNCWGHGAYDGQLKDFFEDPTKANINHDKEQRKAFIQQFVETNVTGIRLKQDGNQKICPKCKVKY